MTPTEIVQLVSAVGLAPAVAWFALVRLEKALESLKGEMAGVRKEVADLRVDVAELAPGERPARRARSSG